MTAETSPRTFRAHKILACAFAASALFGAPEARAQQNPFRAVTDAIGLTKETDDGPDFVRETRPDLKSLNYSPLAGVDKPRAAVKKPAEIEADKAQLIAEREKAEAQRKKLQAEQVAPVAPNPAPPIKDE